MLLLYLLCTFLFFTLGTPGVLFLNSGLVLGLTFTIDSFSLSFLHTLYIISCSVLV